VSSFTNLSVTPFGLLNVLNYITLLPVVELHYIAACCRFFFCFFYALCVVYVAFYLRLFTLVCVALLGA